MRLCPIGAKSGPKPTAQPGTLPRLLPKSETPVPVLDSQRQGTNHIHKRPAERKRVVGEPTLCLDSQTVGLKGSQW